MREKAKNAELFGFSRVCGPASEKIPGPLEKYGANGSEQSVSKYHQKTREFQSDLRLEIAHQTGILYLNLMRNRNILPKKSGSRSRTYLNHIST